MSHCFTDICLSDTDTASSLCCRKVATNCRGESTRDSRTDAMQNPASLARTKSSGGRVLLQHLRHGLLDARQLERFGKMGVAGGLQKRLRLLVHHVAGEEDDAPRQLRLFLDRQFIELLAVHLRHTKVGDDQ